MTNQEKVARLLLSVRIGTKEVADEAEAEILALLGDGEPVAWDVFHKVPIDAPEAEQEWKIFSVYHPPGRAEEIKTILENYGMAIQLRPLIYGDLTPQREPGEDEDED